VTNTSVILRQFRASLTRKWERRASAGHTTALRQIPDHLQQSRRLSTGQLTIVEAGLVALMPCSEMKKLEAAYNSFPDRRSLRIAPESERRKMPAGLLRTRAAYVMQIHRQNCAVCRYDT
jgi:hypothetical protein